MLLRIDNGKIETPRTREERVDRDCAMSIVSHCRSQKDERIECLLCDRWEAKIGRIER